MMDRTYLVDAGEEAAELAADAPDGKHEYARAREVAEAISEDTTPLQKFYKDQCVFVTGATGFLGKILIRKLLQICPDIERIYVVTRPNDKDVQQRESEFIFNHVFEEVRLKNPEIRDKIVAIEGDSTQPYLDLSLKNRQILFDTVSIIFHVAGTGPSNKTLITATQLNSQSTFEIINLCKRMKKLKSFMYVSSAHSYCTQNSIKESTYGHSRDYLQFVSFLENLNDQEVPLSLISPWPDTHTFSKALAEDIIADHGCKLPIGIFRPGLLTPSAEDPTPGWCENNAGVIGIVARTMQGLLRTIRADPSKIANLVPVDMAANALIACAHDVALRQDNTRDKNELVYNYVSTEDAPIMWGDFQKLIIKYANQYPFSHCLWNCALEPIQYEFIHKIYAFLFCWVYAVFTDLYRFLDCREARVRADIKEAEEFADSLSHYTLNEWRYSNDNVRKVWEQFLPEEREICNFDMSNFSWETYSADFVQGIRTHVLKDPPSTLLESRRRLKTKFTAEYEY